MSPPPPSLQAAGPRVPGQGPAGRDNHQQQAASQAQYKPYVPPSAADGSSPNDYYRQGGGY
ncbi:hypothetical protein E4U42_004042 [Claviceps africana]|uniref:Uncharacterized protein n=1 Tax=Claviceps africana TaxID=83212 RepID=A0A8K0J5L9_9HYPO|nr:hypothetical protein E4U42_004042 [Claviceps africana]